MEPLSTLGLWGDGDEVFAIEDAFKSIGVKLPVEDAAGWVTVGDLWRSVTRVSPATAKQDEAWNNFRQALSEETCVNWELVTPETTLLDGRGHSVLQRMFFWMRERLSHRNG
ncbi:hypothetical protein [Sphingomonas sp.]|uniref:hypothetical protein n=1 Tax=Sphingomonas sp. TaxID=28214 RepID=UPI00286C3C0D|nr:hypothetical protein [Sphingomonas sp.]